VAVPNKKGVWHLIYIEECPLCGRSTTTCERRDSPRPENPADRYEYAQYWDYCDW